MRTSRRVRAGRAHRISVGPPAAAPRRPAPAGRGRYGGWAPPPGDDEGRHQVENEPALERNVEGVEAVPVQHWRRSASGQGTPDTGGQAMPWRCRRQAAIARRKWQRLPRWPAPMKSRSSTARSPGRSARRRCREGSTGPESEQRERHHADQHQPGRRQDGVVRRSAGCRRRRGRHRALSQRDADRVRRTRPPSLSQWGVEAGAEPPTGPGWALRPASPTSCGPDPSSGELRHVR